MKKYILFTIITFMAMFSLFGQSKKQNIEFKFTDPEHKAVFTCNHIVDNGSPILYVERDSEGDWQFLCGKEDHTEENAKIISLKQAVELDKTLNDLFEMPKGAGADRKTVSDAWSPFKV